MPHHPTRASIDENHKVVFDAALARDADLVVDLLTQHLEPTARHLAAITPEEEDANRRRSTRLPADGSGPGTQMAGR